jgi:DNA ligase (NAD+)
VNPRSTLNRPKDDADREERQARFNRICGEIGVLGDDLVGAGVATKTPATALPPQYLCVIKTEAAKAVLGFFASDYGASYLGRLLALGIDPQAKPKAAAPADAPLAGQTFVLTGTLSQPRGDVAARIKAAGGVVQDAVSKNTRFLVAGAEAGASKIAKARSLGTAVLDEAGLLALLSGTSAPVAAPERPVPDGPSPARPKPAAAPFRQQELF